MSKPPFEFGQTVYIASANAYTRIEVPCPICFGKRIVRLELGNGEMQPFECEMCGKGFEGPRGVTHGYKATSDVSSGEISGIEVHDDSWRISVGHETCRLEDGNVFDNPEAAEARRIILHQEAERQAERNFESQFKSKAKDGSWTVGYHRREIADLERKLAWHRARLGAR